MITELDPVLTQTKWYALHARCNHEKKIVARLEGLGIETFLPSRKIMRKWRDRKKLVEFPLFPGYVFVKTELLRKKDVLFTPGVVRLVGNTGPEPLPESQIDAIKTFLATEVDFDPYPYLVPGKEVEVKRGPLKGVKGVLEEKKNKFRLIVNIELLNNSVATEIDACDVALA